MNPADLPSMLSARPTEDPGCGPACPDEHAIAAYVDGNLEGGTRDDIEGHLADCDHCLALVGLLSGERTMGSTPELVPKPVVERPRRYAEPGARPWTRVAPKWAAAAVVLMGVAGLLRLSHPFDPVDGLKVDSNARVTRAAPENVPELRVLSPRPGATVRASRFIVRWTPVRGSHYYDVRLVTDAGELMAEEHVTGTEWRLTDQSALQPGAEYFVHVDAFIADDKSVSSEHIAFRVSE